jgi:hypothetical protein
MTTLGERLKARETREEADKIAKLQRESAEAGEKALEDLHAVQEYFDRVKANIIADIMGDRPVRKITLGLRGDNSGNVASILCTYNWTSNVGDRSIAEPHHKYHAVWEKFEQWADSEGLDVSFQYQWDTGGMESWYELKVKLRT